MRWNLFIYSLVDARIITLFIILFFFLFIAFFLLFIDLRLKKKEQKLIIQESEGKRIDKLKSDLQGAGSVDERISIINLYAKTLFKERFGIDEKSYSELIELFDSKKYYDYSLFCKKMFEVYYSGRARTDKNVNELFLLLINVIRNTESYLDFSEVDEKEIVESRIEEGLEDIKKGRGFLYNVNEDILLNKKKSGLSYKQVQKKLQKMISDRKKLLLDQNKTLNKKNSVYREEQKTDGVNVLGFNGVDKKRSDGKNMIGKEKENVNLKNKNVNSEKLSEVKKEESLDRNLSGSGSEERVVKGFSKEVDEDGSLVNKEKLDEKLDERREKVSEDTGKVSEGDLVDKGDEAVDADWRGSIDANPLSGSDWLKKRKRGGF